MTHRDRFLPTSSLDDLSRAVSELENSREALERRLKAESEATDAEKSRAKGAEARFERLLAWARVQEQRRRKAEEGLRSAYEGTQAAKAGAKVVEEEVRTGKKSVVYQVAVHAFVGLFWCFGT